MVWQYVVSFSIIAGAYYFLYAKLREQRRRYVYDPDESNSNDDDDDDFMSAVADIIVFYCRFSASFSIIYIPIH